MSNTPEPDDEALLERYRRASAAEPLTPTDAVRAAILAEAARVAAEQRPAPALAQFDTSVPAANQWRWQLTAFGTLAAAVIAAILVVPQFHRAPPSPADERTATDGRTDARMADAATTSVARVAAEPAAPAAPPASVARFDSPTEQDRRQLEPAAASAVKAGPPSTPGPAPALQALADVDTPAASRQEPVRADSTVCSAHGSAPAVAQEPYNGPVASAAPAAAGAVADSTARHLTSKHEMAPSNLTAAARIAAAAEDRGAALHTACALGDTNAIDRLLAAGAPLESPDPRGRTPLMVAAAGGRIDAVRVLLAHGASAKAVDREGQDAIALARRAGFDKVAAEIERFAHH